MTNIDFNTDVRNGALACIDAMKIIEQIAGSGNSDWSIDDCFKNQNIAVNAALLAAGDVPKRLQGLISAMAEYIYMCNSAGTPNLELWKPEAAMTDDEFRAYRLTYIESDAEIRAVS
jgi:hypothetical protein